MAEEKKKDKKHESWDEAIAGTEQESEEIKKSSWDDVIAYSGHKKPKPQKNK
ncbi:MAG: hypothetical protein WCW17_00790 [Patescibacteria group bacterium]|jgi:hypothetical protein